VPSASASFAPLADLPAGPSAVPAAQADTLVAHGSLRLELLEAGGAPRQPLRTSLRPGRTERAQLTAEVTLTVAVSGAPEPQLVPRMKVAVEAQMSKNDSLSVKLTEVTLDGTVDGERLADARAHAAKLVGVSFELPVGERGRKGPPSVPKGAVGPALQLWSTVAEVLRELVVPLPAEPVGRGARWQVFERLPRGGVEMLRRTRYTLLALEGAEMRLRGEVEEVAIVGGADDPALPKEVRVTPIEGTAKGEHSVRRPLVDAVLPSASESQLQSRLVAEGSERATVTLRQTIHFEKPRKKEGP
jgi:hypothetical protein